MHKGTSEACPELIEFFGYEVNKQDLLVGAALLDFVATLGFIFMAFLFQRRIAKIAKQVGTWVIVAGALLGWVGGWWGRGLRCRSL